MRKILVIWIVTVCLSVSLAGKVRAICFINDAACLAPLLLGDSYYNGVTEWSPTVAGARVGADGNI